MKNLIEKHPFLMIWILFLISFAFRFYCADFDKSIYTYFDELYYYQIAENLGRFQGILIYNLPTEFQKILYPLFLAPAFFFENREMQQHAIALINAFLITSSIFPIYFIAKELLEKNKDILLICFVSLFLPELAIASTLMSEVLFFPLSLLLFYGYLKIILKGKENTFLAFLVGVGSFLLYLTKEVGILFPIAFLSYIFIDYFLNRNLAQFKNKLKFFGIILSVFALLFLFCNFIIFKGEENFYSDQSGFFSAFDFLGASTLFFFFYSALIFILHIALASLFFPVLFTCAHFKALNSQNQKALLFLGILLLFSTLIIAYSIFIREGDFLNPRPLTRYVIYAPILFLIIYFSLVEKKLTTPPQFCFIVVPCSLFYFFTQSRNFDHRPIPPLYLFLKMEFFSTKKIFIFSKLFLPLFLSFYFLKRNAKKLF